MVWIWKNDLALACVVHFLFSPRQEASGFIEQLPSPRKGKQRSPWPLATEREWADRECRSGLLLVGRVRRETGQNRGSVSTNSVDAAEIKRLRGSEVAELTTMSCTVFPKEETGTQLHSIPLGLATGATVTQNTEGRNVQKEAGTAKLDLRDNMNKEELSFGKEKTAETLHFLNIFAASS